MQKRPRARRPAPARRRRPRRGGRASGRRSCAVLHRRLTARAMPAAPPSVAASTSLLMTSTGARRSWRKDSPMSRMNTKRAADERHGPRRQPLEQRIGEARELPSGGAKDSLGGRIAPFGGFPHGAGEFADLAAVSAIDEGPHHVPVGAADALPPGRCRGSWTSPRRGFPPRRAGRLSAPRGRSRSRSRHHRSDCRARRPGSLPCRRTDNSRSSRCRYRSRMPSPSAK